MIKDLLIAQLTDIHATMLGVHERNQELNMHLWVTKSTTLGGHFCDTVACICGWQALGNLENFPGATAWATNDTTTPSGVAARLSGDLDGTCSKVFGRNCLAPSIHDGDTYCRRRYAEDSELFSKKELRHPHLNKEDPTALEAADFIALCIKKVKRA